MKDEQTHLGMTLDSSLTFHGHIKDKTIKADRGIGMIRYLSKYVTQYNILLHLQLVGHGME